MAVRNETRVRLAGGAATVLERWGERGPAVLCVHGMTSSRRSWERLAEHLADRFRIFAYDQRGHGDSAAWAGPMALAQGVDDLRDVAASLGEPVETLIGHSWGGAIAILGGAVLPVRRVAAIDPMVRNADAAWYREYLDELTETFALAGEARDRRTREEYAAWAPADVEAKVHAVHAMTVASIEGLWKENPPASWDLRALVAAYDKPLLLAMAARGEGINDDAVLDEIERRHSARVEIVTFPGAGHNVHRTAFDALTAALDAWLV